MAQTPEQKAETQRRRRARLAGLKAAAEQASKPEPKAVRRAINGRDPVASLARRVDANSHHFFFLAQGLEAEGQRADRAEGRMDEHLALMGQLADQNALLRDQLAQTNWRVEQLETRFGLLRAVLTDDAPLLTSLDDALDSLASSNCGGCRCRSCGPTRRTGVAIPRRSRMRSGACWPRSASPVLCWPMRRATA